MKCIKMMDCIRIITARWGALHLQARGDRIFRSLKNSDHNVDVFKAH